MLTLSKDLWARWQPGRTTIAVAVMLLFYGCGLIGISIPATKDWFLAATPLNLVLTLGLFLWANDFYPLRFVLMCFFIYGLAFFVEVAGVHTQKMFGSYWYGQTLGLKWLNVPLLIGANWLLLVLCTAGMVQAVKVPAMLRWLLAAVLMTALDWLIEPVAVRLHFWQWQNNHIPLQNFVGWFITSFVLQVLLHRVRPQLDKWLCFFVFGLQVVFFSVLQITARL